MLSQEENDLLTRTGPDTPMGRLMRRYWIPAVFSHQVAKPDCPPVRVKLMGENLVAFRDTMAETRDYGFEKLREAQWALGNGVREMLAEKGIRSVAAPGFAAPGVVVSYTDDPDVQNGKKFAALGMQIAAGVPLQCDEPADFRTFRLGLFGLDKLYDVEGTIARLKGVVDQVL